MEPRKGNKRKRSEDAGPSSTFLTAHRPRAIRVHSNRGQEFKQGAVRWMRLHNFLTFDDVEFFPSPQLNVIVAPNGTGKSSLVCGLCLGLAGQTRLLGRARELKEFVKHAKDNAFIEIELHRSDGNHVQIKRSFHRQDNHSKWFVNGREKLERDVVKVVQDCRIQLENKCQFLPQDIVVEFAKLDIYMLLEETEKAIGPHDMFETHTKLKTFKQGKSAIESKLNNKKEELQRLQQRNQLLERDVQRIHNQRACLERVKNLRCKKVWLEYDEARQKYDEVKVARRTAVKQLKDLKNVHGPLRQKLQENEAIVNEFRRKERSQGQRIAGFLHQITEKQGELASQLDCIEEARKEFDRCKREEELRLKKIQRMEGEIESFKSELNSLEPADTIQPRIAEKNARIHVLHDRMGQLQNREQNLLESKEQQVTLANRAQEDLSEMEDLRNQRLELLGRRDRDTWQAIKWLRENRDKFQATVFEPILVLLNVRDMQYASLVEDCFSGRDFYSFVSQNKADHDLFMREVRDRQNLRINAVMAPREDLESFRCPLQRDQLRQWGFQQMVMDLVEAPSPVLAYFCRYHHLHKIPIADRLTEAQVESFIHRQREILKFYTGNTRYIVKRSRFNRDKVITLSSQVNHCQFLSSSVDETRKAALLADINEARRNISEYEKQLEEIKTQDLQLRREDGQLRREKNELQEITNNRRRLKRSIESKEVHLRGLQTSPADLAAEETKMKRSVKKSQEKRMDLLEKLSQYSVSYSEQLRGKVKSHLNLIQAERRKEYLHSRYQSSTDELKTAEAAVNRGKEEEGTAKERAVQLMKIAREKSGYHSPEDFSPQLADILFSLPNTLSEIDDAIHENKTKAEVLVNPGEDVHEVLQEFESRENKIDELREEIRHNENELVNHEERTQRLKESWLTPLIDMMCKVNERFSRFFSQMGCAGEVSLLKHEDDFSKYGVQIRVKFRDEDELHVLDAHRQSGGERSVSTMLYLMALQDITSCPFRVVDEINQGMDSRNERKVFDLIVDTVSSANTSQYFLLTPKLLQGLKYTPQVKVHCIQNGPESLQSSQWDMSQFLV